MFKDIGVYYIASAISDYAVFETKWHQKLVEENRNDFKQLLNACKQELPFCGHN